MKPVYFACCCALLLLLSSCFLRPKHRYNDVSDATSTARAGISVGNTRWEDDNEDSNDGQLYVDSSAGINNGNGDGMLYVVDSATYTYKQQPYQLQIDTLYRPFFDQDTAINEDTSITVHCYTRSGQRVYWFYKYPIDSCYHCRVLLEARKKIAGHYSGERDSVATISTYSLLYHLHWLQLDLTNCNSYYYTVDTNMAHAKHGLTYSVDPITGDTGRHEHTFYYPMIPLRQ